MAYNPTIKPQDYIVLSGQRSPGVATVSNADTVMRIAVRRGYGFSYGTSVFRGVELCKPKVTIVLSSAEDFDDWEIWSRLVSRPEQGERARAMDIEHPLINAAGCRSVMLEKATQLTETGDTGEWSVTLEFVEFNRPVFTLARPSASEPEALTEAERQIEQRLVILNFERGLSGST